MSYVSEHDLDAVLEKINSDRKIQAVVDVRAIIGVSSITAKAIVDDVYSRPQPERDARLTTLLANHGYVVPVLPANATNKVKSIKEERIAWTKGKEWKENLPPTPAGMLSSVLETNLASQGALLAQILEQVTEQTQLLKDLMEVMSE